MKRLVAHATGIVMKTLVYVHLVSAKPNGKERDVMYISVGE